MGYPDLKDLRTWAGIKRNSDDDTDPQVPLFNWDDLDIRSSPRVKKAPVYFAQIEISMYADLANPRLAVRKARQEFLYYSGCGHENIQWMKLFKYKHITSSQNFLGLRPRN